MSKRAPYNYGVDQSGKTYWRSLEEHAGSPEFQQALEREFPEGASELSDPVSRRSFIGLMGASLGLAGLAGCRRPEEKILPYSKRPEDLIPGRPMFFATAMPFGDTAIGLLVESHEGRPTKIEGNPEHPDSLGAANLFAQASVLELYDPDRSQNPRNKGTKKSWEDAAGALRQAFAAAKAKGGAGLAIVTEGHRSPTLAAQLARVTEQMPQARIVRYEPNSSQSRRDGTRLAYGRPLETVLALEGAQVVVAIDSDLLLTEGSPIRQARNIIDNRRVNKPGDPMNRVYAVESRFSITGATADHRLRLASREIPGFVLALAKELSTAHGVDLGPAAAALGNAPAQSGNAAKWVKALAADLAKNKGTSALHAGRQQPAFVHALVALINQGLGNVGRTVRLVRPFDEASDGPEALADLAKAMNAGQIDTLLVLGANPVFTAPADANFEQGLAKVANSFHLGLYADETAEKSAWHLNRAHFLEAWGDVRTQDGTVSIVQPLIAPLYEGKSDAEVVELALGSSRKGYELVRQTWTSQFGGTFEKSWRQALHDGFIQGTRLADENVAPAGDGLAQAAAGWKAEQNGLEITFHPDSHALDGRFANNGWLQELPDQMTKQSWGNAALVSPATAKQLGVVDNDVVELSVNGKSAKIAVLVQPGQADNSVAVTYGQGRRVVGLTGKGAGYDTYPLRSAAAFFAASGGGLKKTGETDLLARTQEHHTMEGRPLVREATLVQFNKRPTFAQDMVKVERFNLFSEEDEHKYLGHKWGMTIDLNACIGCNSCMVACQSENNIPLVGKDGVLRGREMHWLRIDRYFEGTVDDPQAVMQPMACVHCENAPCELVCPVAATEHSPEGLNDMAYNRCVGTRYCANNCPYKVRRFNFFNYNKDVPEVRKMQFNPNVTVRYRGVMEKCTYCVQRIQEAKIAARREGRVEERNGEKLALVHDGEVVSACAQTCPTKAIKFGDLNDPKSQVAIEAGSPRNYGVLAEINTRPRTTYLARVRNPNPELETA